MDAVFRYMPAMLDSVAPPMPIPGHIDPVPVPRAKTLREDGRIDLIGLGKDELRQTLLDAGMEPRQAKLRAKQIWHWLYNRGATEFSAMTDIAKAQHPWLEQRFVIGRPEVVEAQVSTDGTRKWLLRSPDGQDYEAVFIPDADRGTLCVSSQVGCTLNCRFCHTGTMRLVRNLTAGEIVGQVMLARDALGEWPSQPEGRMLTNIVMMGMGEPLYNFDSVRDALKLVMDGDGLALSKRRITLSTSGVVPMMARARRRDRRKPRRVAACRDQGGARRDRAAQQEIRHRRAVAGVRRLSRRQQRAPHHVRICDAEGQERFGCGSARARPPAAQVQAARQGQSDPVQPLAGRAVRYVDAGAGAPVQRHHLRSGHLGAGAYPRGRDIDAACGQLKTAAEKKSRAQMDREAEEKMAALG